MTYRQYRSYGHGRLTAFTLSVHPIVWYGTAVIAGVVCAFV